GAGFLGASIGPAYFLIISDGLRQNLRSDEIVVSVVFSWLISEPLFALLGAVNAGVSLERWRRQSRLEEIRLTCLRPIVVAQMILLYQLRSRLCFIAAVFVGFAGFIILFEPLWMAFVILYALIAINAAVSFYVFGWIFLTLRLDLDMVRAVAAMLMALMVCALWIIPPILLVALWMTETSVLFSTSSAMDVAFYIVIIPATLSWCAIKYLFARAYAARLERIVFPRMDY
ncbi:MAG: hypothetical protein NTX50_13925, partial [Candidatus Sumerlaeota bacterium]|nr:hypothetical protein [Candidatus Sumerlaeota bacterium]